MIPNKQNLVREDKKNELNKWKKKQQPKKMLGRKEKKKILIKN